MIPAPFEYRAPESLEEVFLVLSRYGESARILAGGQSLIPALKARAVRPSVLVDLRRVPGLDAIDAEQDGFRIGALVTYRRLERDPLVVARCPVIADVAALVGDVQVRSLGTLVGSICNAEPGADFAAVLIALEAEVEIAGRRGTRTVRVEDFFQGSAETALEPDEMATSVRVRDARSCAYSRRPRGPVGYALVGVAARIDVEGGRIRRASLGVTGVGPRPYRAGDVEATLSGEEPRPESFARAAGGLTGGAMDDLNGSAEYRIHLAQVLAKRALDLAAGRAT